MFLSEDKLKLLRDKTNFPTFVTVFVVCIFDSSFQRLQGLSTDTPNDVAEESSPNDFTL